MAVSPPTSGPKPKPSIPAKNKNVDDFARLRKELDEAKEARDAMEDDLLNAQEELEAKEAELKQKTKEVEEKDIELKQKSREVWTWREKAEKLSNEMADERRSPGPGKRSPPVPPSTTSFASREASMRSEKELAEARRQLEELKSALTEANAKLEAKEWDIVPPDLGQQSPAAQENVRNLENQINQLQDQCRSEQKLRRAAEGNLEGTRNYFEGQLKDMETQARTRIDEQQRQLQELQSSGMQRMEVDLGNNEELERLRRVSAEQEQKMDELRQCSDQYRRMSERLTSQVKQMSTSQRNQEQSEQLMRQQRQPPKSQLGSAQMQIRSMPGAFQRM